MAEQDADQRDEHASKRDLNQGLTHFVRRINTLRGAIMYDSRVDDHHHVICRQCGRMQDLDVARVSIALSGLCPDCVT